MAPLSSAFLLVVSVLFCRLYYVLALGGMSWLGYLLCLLFIGGVLVVLLVLTSLSGIFLNLGVSVSLWFKVVILCITGRLIPVYREPVNFPLRYFVYYSSWRVGVLGCTGCFMYLVFLRLMFKTRGPLRKLLRTIV